MGSQASSTRARHSEQQSPRLRYALGFDPDMASLLGFKWWRTPSLHIAYQKGLLFESRGNDRVCYDESPLDIKSKLTVGQ